VGRSIFDLKRKVGSAVLQMIPVAIGHWCIAPVLHDHIQMDKAECCEVAINLHHIVAYLSEGEQIFFALIAGVSGFLAVALYKEEGGFFLTPIFTTGAEHSAKAPIVPAMKTVETPFATLFLN
jgi:hypothetical protein